MIFTCMYSLCTSKIYLQLIILSQGDLFLMVSSLGVMHELILTIPSDIQISSINSIRFRFNLGETSITVMRTSLIKGL